MKFIFAMIIVLGYPVKALTSEAASTANNDCYSAYAMEQSIDLSINFGLAMERRKTNVASTIHVRKIMLSSSTIQQYEKLSTGDVHAYLFLLEPVSMNSNGISLDSAGRYDHPFLSIVDSDNGKLIDLLSSSVDQKVIKEYLAFYDLFQYSESEGEYTYRNGNGSYQATIEKGRKSNSAMSILKSNDGYVSLDESAAPNIDILSSGWTLSIDSQSQDCFYTSAVGSESFESELSGLSMIAGSTTVNLASTPSLRLTPSHFFHTLTDDLTLWPRHAPTKSTSLTEAMIELPFAVTKLSAFIDNDKKFLEALAQEQALWPYLFDYIAQHGITDELSKQLFWGLDRIDTKASVHALTKLAAGELNRRDHFRAVVALSSTSAPLNEAGIDLLKGRFTTNLVNLDPTSDALIMPRMMGAVAHRRLQTDPSSAADIREFLYTQVGTSTDTGNSAVISAIGNLKDGIDSTGEQILLEQLAVGSVSVRHSAASAFNRIPFNVENSAKLLDQTRIETNRMVQVELIKNLGRAPADDVEVKNTLIELSGHAHLSEAALGALQRLDPRLEPNDIEVLSTTLSQTDVIATQKILATLILKNRKR